MRPKQILARMILKGVTQAEISRSLGVNRTTVHGVIHGRWVSRRVAEEVARRIDLPLEKVFEKYAS
ncbi:MAG: helix-turn-helix domain-containing protein [Pigmentiphaga sp.]